MSIFNDNDIILNADKTLVLDWFKRNSDYRQNELNFNIYIEDDVIKADILKGNGIRIISLNSHPEKMQGFVLNRCDVDLFGNYINFQDIPNKCPRAVYINLDPYKIGEFNESLKNANPKVLDFLYIRIKKDENPKSSTTGGDIYTRLFVKKFKEKYTKEYFKELGISIRHLMIY